jgi:uncharacterized protein
VKKSFQVLLLIFFLKIFTCFSYALPIENIKPTDYVTDYTNTLTRDEILEISKILGNLEREKKYSVAVVVVPDMSGDYLEHYANKLYTQLSIGNKEKDEGALFLIVKNEKLMRIEVGYGLEPILTDGITKNIQDNFVRPYFKNNDYFAGIKNGVLKINETLSGPVNAVSSLGVAEGQKNSYNNLFGIFVFIFMFGINILAWIVSV